MSIKRVKTGWQVDVQFGFQGKRIRETFPNHVLAKRHEAQLKSEFLEKRHFPESFKSSITLPDFINEYLDRHVSSLTWANVVSCCLKIIADSFAGIPISKISQEDLEVWLLNMEREKKWKQATRNYYIALLKTLFRKAVEWKKIKVSPALYLAKKDPQNERTRFASWEELNRLWDKATPRLSRFLIGLLNTGVRKGRLEALEWTDINLESRLIRVKNKKGREYWVRINQTLCDELSTVPVENRTGRVFDTTNLRKDWEKALRDAKIEDLHMHDLRHTFATRTTEKTKDLNKTQKALGHASPMMTNRYRHVIDEALVEAFESVSFKPNHSVDKVSIQGLKQAVSDSRQLLVSDECP